MKFKNGKEWPAEEFSYLTSNSEQYTIHQGNV